MHLDVSTLGSRNIQMIVNLQFFIRNADSAHIIKEEEMESPFLYYIFWPESHFNILYSLQYKFVIIKTEQI